MSQSVRQTPSYQERFALPLLLLATFLLSAAWASSTPIPQVGPGWELWGSFHPDEISHTSVVRYLAVNHALPPYLWPYDTSVHPPLYHGLGAVVYALALAPLGDDRAMLLVRLCTALCGVGIVYLTFAATRQVASRQTALLAALFVVLIPMRAALGGAVTNENLAALGAAGVLAVLIAGVVHRDGFTKRRLALLTMYLVVGIGSKITCLGLLPVAVVALLWRGRTRAVPVVTQIAQTAVVVSGPLLCWGWWFARNQRLYGDPMRQAAADRLWAISQPGFAFYAATRHLSATKYALSLSAHGWLSFWGKLDGLYMPWPVYALPLLLEIVAVLGWWRLLRGEVPRDKMSVGEASNVSGDEKNSQPAQSPLKVLLPLFLLFTLFTAFVLAVFYGYNWKHYTPQGRYFFVLLVPYGLMASIGWQTALPHSIRRWATRLLVGLMVALNLYVLYVVPRRIAMPLGFGRVHQKVPVAP